MIITLPIQLTAGHITEVTEVTAPMVQAMVQATVRGMQPIQVPLRSKLATGRTTLAALVITWAAPITFGDRDIGDGVMVKESGSTDTTL
jgi:hypothetical protein